MRLSEPALLVDITGHRALRGIGVRGEPPVDRRARHACRDRGLAAGGRTRAHAGRGRAAHRAPRDPQRGTWGGSHRLCRPGGRVAVLPAGAGRQRHRAGGRRAAGAPCARHRLLRRPLHHRLAPDEILLGADVPLATTADWFASTNWRGAAATTRRRAWPSRRASTAPSRADVRLAFLGIGATPLRAPRTEALLAGKTLDPRPSRSRSPR
jgi:carbon-monoxide dehydrogenase medium subunit